MLAKSIIGASMVLFAFNALMCRQVKKIQLLWNIIIGTWPFVIAVGRNDAAIGFAPCA